MGFSVRMVTDITGDPDNAALASALLAQKEATGISYEEIARLSGLGLRSVKRYLHDERVMSIAKVRVLTKALGVPFGKFMGEHVAGIE